MSAPATKKQSSLNETICHLVARAYFQLLMVKIVYLNFFEVNSILFKEVHEIVEVLCTRFVVTAVRPDGLNPEQIEKFSQMHR
jgi:hypothetical protein